MAAPSLTAHTLDAAANLRHASSSVAHVAQGYARSLRPSLAGFSPPQRVIRSGGDR